jgi:hypothetical protein
MAKDKAKSDNAHQIKLEFDAIYKSLIDKVILISQQPVIKMTEEK